MVSVLVRGAGVAGLCAAYECARRGAQVTVLEINPGLGHNASWLAGGMLAPYCEGEQAEAIVVQLGRQAADWWEDALPGLVHRKGTLVLAPPRDAAELTRFASRTHAFARLGADGVESLEPDLVGRFLSGLFFREEAHLDPRAALAGLVARLTGLGVECRFGGAPEAAGRAFNFTIDCRGLASGHTGLRGVRGEMLLLRTPEITLSRPVRLLHPQFPVYVVPRGGGVFMVGATMLESAGDTGPSARSVMELLNAAYTLHPAFAEAEIVEMGAGVRPAYPDNAPRITRDGRTLRLNGFYRHGFLLAPALARQAAGQIFENEMGDVA